jgi:hypothetical protein
MLSNDARFQLADGVTYQLFDAGGEGVILSMKSGYLYGCNSTAAEFLEGLRRGDDLGDIARRLARTYDVDCERTRDDLRRLAEVMIHDGLVRQVA